jgi:hypothetical protein
MVNIHIFWTMMEVGIALIAICLPLFRPGTLLKKNHWLQRWLGSVGTKISRSARPHSVRHHQSSHSTSKGIPGVPRAKHVPLVSAAESFNGAYSKMGSGDSLEMQGNGKYGYVVDVEGGKGVREDTEMQEQDFQRRYQALFPVTGAPEEKVVETKNMV